MPGPGNWPSPYGNEAITHAATASDGFLKGMALHPTGTAEPFEVPFSNGTATVDMPGILVTPDAIFVFPAPLVIITAGPAATKEQAILQYGFQFLWRGYAVLAVEGPGQGAVIKTAPHMPLYAKCQQVLSAILDYVTASLGQYVQVESIAEYGVGKGSYFAARACSDNNDRLAVCILNPTPVPSNYITSQYLEPLFIQKYYAPLQFAAQ